MNEPGGLAWRKPRQEALLLVLIAAVALLPLNGPNTQDQSRLCLAQALTHGHLYADDCLARSLDHARYGGHLYSDKAPGLALVDVLPEWAIAAQPDRAGLRLWAVRALVSGLSFVLCAFMVGRVGEGIQPGRGAAALAAFGVGTLAPLFAGVGFSEVPTAAAGFAAFVVAWRGKPLAAGAIAGSAVLLDYDAALILAAVGAYLGCRGARVAARYVLGALPAAGLLGLYDWIAFGRPWHLSYRYVDSALAAEQTKNFFGIGLPRAFSIYDVFVGSGGVLVTCPILLAAAFGLVLVPRRWRAEALTCAAVVGLYLALDCGYFLPYGGTPVPRFLVPCLPFLAVGLAPAFAAAPRAVALATSVSAVAVVALTATWVSKNPNPGTVWEALGRLPAQLGHAKLLDQVNPSILGEIGVGRLASAALLVLAAFAALAVGIRSLPRPAERSHGRTVSPARLRVAVAVAFVAVSVADVAAVSAYPYGRLTLGVVPASVDLTLVIAASKPVAFPGDDVELTVTVANPEPEALEGVLLTVTISPGLELRQASSDSGAMGCRGASIVGCSLGTLPTGRIATVHLGLRIAESTAGRETVTASAVSRGVPARHPAAFTIVAGS